MECSVVADASPLIYFAKLDRLDLLYRVIGPAAISPAVYREAVIAGRARGLIDAERILAAIMAGWVERISLGEDEARLAQTLQQGSPRLGPGECETIACALHRSYKAILHDKGARRVASRYHVPTMQSVDVMFLALLRGHVSLSGFGSLLRNLAVLTGMDPATLFERQALAEEIAARLNLSAGGADEGDHNHGPNSATQPSH